ncbi:MAG TPA: GH92 family glycosyl hydrolase [Bacteroidales bacterium]|nr:GH92 family glycosyl hydrolase [Bacteroidales bacterium]
MKKHQMKALSSVSFIFIVIIAFSCSTVPALEKDPVDFVNPYMGNISHLLVPTYPTVSLPNSMLRIYPERGDYTGLMMRGLPVMVTSHRGSHAFSISPLSGEPASSDPVISYSYDLENVTPYSYSVYLDEKKIGVNLAVSHRSALYTLSFSDRKPFILIRSFDGEMKWNGKSVSGFQNLENNTRVYIYLETDIAPLKSGILTPTGISFDELNTSGHNACVVLRFPEETEKVSLRYGISFISEQQAEKNLANGIKSFDPDQVLAYGRRTWNDALGKIKVSGGSEDDMTVFYTSLYRTYERPVNITEDGLYFSAFDGKVHDTDGIDYYTDDWIWDTYRAAHPLRILIDPEKETEIISSYLRMTDHMKNQWMPTFPVVTGDNRAMNSNHGVATVLDAWRKGLKGFDLEKAYNVCMKAITEKTLAPWSDDKPAGKLDEFYREKGYFPALSENEKETNPEVHPFEKRQPVAVTLGASYDEWCLSQIAGELGKTDDHKYFLRQSYNYRNLFNPETGFFHPKDSRGNFIMPFDYKFSGGMGARDYFDENNAYTYRWDVQHNIGDLVSLFGGNDMFISALDNTFTEPLGRSKYAFYAQLPDQTGNVGQFSMANEPSLHIPYLYNYAGQPWKTQKMIRTLLHEWFRNDLMGIPGDEDGGGTSAFVVFSQLGFYPVTPGSPTYNIGSPVFPESVIDLGNGKTFRIISANCSFDNKYIQSAKLNGHEWNKPWFSHDDIKNGGTLELVMGDKANPRWGNSNDAAPPSAEKAD